MAFELFWLLLWFLLLRRQILNYWNTFDNFTCRLKIRYITNCCLTVKNTATNILVTSAMTTNNDQWLKLTATKPFLPTMTLMNWYHTYHSTCTFLPSKHYATNGAPPFTTYHSLSPSLPLPAATYCHLLTIHLQNTNATYHPPFTPLPLKLMPLPTINPPYLCHYRTPNATTYHSPVH